MPEKPKNTQDKKQRDSKPVPLATPAIHDQARWHWYAVLVTTSCGALLLFAAWIAQNHFQPVWLDEKLYLEKTQFLIQNEQVEESLWQNEYNQEVRRAPKDPQLYGAAAYNLIRSLTNLIAWDEARIQEDTDRTDPIAVKNLKQNLATSGLYEKGELDRLTKALENSDRTDPIAVKNLTQDLAKRLYEKGDWDRLDNVLQDVIETKNRFQPSLNQKYLDRMAEVMEKSDQWNRRFT